MSYRDDVYDQQHQKEETNLISTSVLNTLQQRMGQAKLEEASAMNEEVRNIAAKACIMALTNNSKKLEARTK